MRREWLKELGLEADVIDKVMDENGKDVNKAKKEVETLKTEKTDLEGQLKTANDTISDLKKNNKGNDDLQTKVTEYEKTIETMKSDAQKKEFDLALENELIKLNVHSTKAARAELDLEKVKYENGAFVGLKEQTDTWAKDKAYLIKTGKVETTYTPPGGDPSNSTSYAESLAESKNQKTDNPYANAWG